MKNRKGTIAEVIMALIVIVVCCVLFVGPCVYDYSRRHISGNQKVFDTKWNYKFADLYLPGGEKKTIEIKSWNDYQGEQIQIESVDGTVYLVSSYNTILRSK